MLLMIDNYDSFTYNLVQYFGELGADVRVYRNDEISVEQIAALAPEQIVVSPGPCSPAEAGISVAAIQAFAGKIPLLGVCLGHQAIAEAMGATVTHAEELMHGKVSRVTHSGDSFFAGVAEEFQATRYHSLAVVRDTVPAELAITAETASGIVMALRHTDLPIYGVQYHPESVLTEGGYRQLGNWLVACGSPTAAEIAATLSPLLSAK